MIDGHVHLENGDLSVDYAMQFVNAAAEKGIDTLQILDHTHRFLEFCTHVRRSAKCFRAAGSLA